MSKKELKVTASINAIYSHVVPLNPQETLIKAELALFISDIIKEKKLTQKQAAKLIRVDQPKISAIIRGQFSGFTIDRLVRFLMGLGMDIIIKVKPYTSDKK